MIFGDKDQMNETDKILHLMEACRLCPRECDVNRLKGKKGFCGVDAKVMVARAALHMWEEPCISGKEGSGAVFFSGCSLGCGFCQNRWQLLFHWQITISTSFAIAFSVLRNQRDIS